MTSSIGAFLSHGTNASTHRTTQRSSAPAAKGPAAKEEAAESSVEKLSEAKSTSHSHNLGRAASSASAITGRLINKLV